MPYNWPSPNTLNQNVLPRNYVPRNQAPYNLLPENIQQQQGSMIRPSDTAPMQSSPNNWNVDIREGGMNPLQARPGGGYDIAQTPNPNSPAELARRRMGGSLGPSGTTYMPQMPQANAPSMMFDEQGQSALGQNIARAERAREGRQAEAAASANQRALDALSQLSFVHSQIPLNVTPEWDPFFQGAQEAGVRDTGAMLSRAIRQQKPFGTPPPGYTNERAMSEIDTFRHGGAAPGFTQTPGGGQTRMLPGTTDYFRRALEALRRSR